MERSAGSPPPPPGCAAGCCAIPLVWLLAAIVGNTGMLITLGCYVGTAVAQSVLLPLVP